MKLPLRPVVVAGTSMVPTLRPGDFCLVRRTRDVRVGDLVVVRRPDRPDFLLVKRVEARTGDGWWVVGDNPHASDDSNVFGAVSDEDVLGRVVVRYWPLFRRRSS